MLILKSLKEIPVTRDLILKEAEKTLFDRFLQKRIRTAFQLRAHLAALGALGLALKDTATVKTIEILLRGTWVPGSWA